MTDEKEKEPVKAPKKPADSLEALREDVNRLWGIVRRMSRQFGIKEEDGRASILALAAVALCSIGLIAFAVSPKEDAAFQLMSRTDATNAIFYVDQSGNIAMDGSITSAGVAQTNMNPIVNNLTVRTNAGISGALSGGYIGSAGYISGKDLISSNTLTVNGIETNVGGILTKDWLIVQTNANIGGTLTVTGAATIVQGLTVSTNISAKSVGAQTISAGTLTATGNVAAVNTAISGVVTGGTVVLTGAAGAVVTNAESQSLQITVNKTNYWIKLYLPNT